MHRPRLATLAMAAVLFLPLTASAEDMGYGVVTPEKLVWGLLDPKAPEGIQLAVLYGDPSKPGPFGIRAKFPAGLEVASHTHSNDEYITIVSGKAMVSWGIKTDIASGDTLEPGTFFWLKGGQHHTFKAVEETVLEVHSTGPFDVVLDK